MAPKIAENHPSISKFGKNAATILRTAPLTTKVKSPSVKILIGKVKNMRSGQTYELAKPIAKAAIKAEKIPPIRKPAITFEVSRIARAEIAQ